MFDYFLLRLFQISMLSCFSVATFNAMQGDKTAWVSCPVFAGLFILGTYFAEVKQD